MFWVLSRVKLLYWFKRQRFWVLSRVKLLYKFKKQRFWVLSRVNLLYWFKRQRFWVLSRLKLLDWFKRQRFWVLSRLKLLDLFKRQRFRMLSRVFNISSLGHRLTLFEIHEHQLNYMAVIIALRLTLGLSYINTLAPRLTVEYKMRETNFIALIMTLTLDINSIEAHN